MTRAEEKARSFHVNQRPAFARDINGYICFCLIEIYMSERELNREEQYDVTLLWYQNSGSQQ